MVRRHQDHIRECLASAGTLDANSFDGFTDTLDVDSTDAPNRNFPEATVIVPRRNPPHIVILRLITLHIITPDDTFKGKSVVTDIDCSTHAH